MLQGEPDSDTAKTISIFTEPEPLLTKISEFPSKLNCFLLKKVKPEGPEVWVDLRQAFESESVAID